MRNYVDGVSVIDVKVDFNMEGSVVDRNTAIIQIVWEIDRTADRSIIQAQIDETTGQVIIETLDYVSPRDATDEYVDGSWQAGSSGATDGRPW